MQNDRVAIAAPRTGPSWVAFAAWAVIGAGFSLGLLSILTIGLGVLALAGLATVALTRWHRGIEGAIGAVSGLAFPVFYVAYLNRGGPGTVCTSTPSSQSCTDEYDPWPFVAVGTVLLAAGLVAFVALRRRAARDGRRELTAAGRRRLPRRS